MEHLLLLHGAIGSKQQLEPLANALRQNFEVHTLDFSGHGGEIIPDTFSIPFFANDVLRFLDTNKITSIHIFGYSMGGYVALYLAKHFSDRVGKIFTFATKFDWTVETSEREVKMLDPEKIEGKIPAFAKILAERHAPQDWKIVLRKTANMMLEMGKAKPLSDDDLRSIQHSVKIGVGEQDKMVSQDETIAVSKLIPNGRLLILADTPHPIEQIALERLVEEIEAYF